MNLDADARHDDEPRDDALRHDALRDVARREVALREVERARLRSLVEADMTAANAVHADEYQLITPSGRALTKAEYLDAVASGELNYRVFEPISEIAMWGDDRIGMLRYVARIEIQDGDELVQLTCWHTDGYEKRAGRWQAVWSHATRIMPLD